MASGRDDTPTWPLIRPFEEIAKPGSLVPVVGEGSASEVARPQPPPDSLWRQVWGRRWVIAGLSTLSFTSALLLGAWSAASKRAPQDLTRVSSARERSPAAPPKAVPPTEGEVSPARVTQDPAAAAAPKEELDERDTTTTEAATSPTPAGAPHRRTRERSIAPATPQQVYRPNRI